jgi:hypothetical protein
MKQFVDIKLHLEDLIYIKNSVGASLEQIENLFEHLDSAVDKAQKPEKMSFDLNAERVRAMKDAGMWDNPTKRTEIIKKFIQEERDKQIDEQPKRKAGRPKKNAE